jgi:outer membrane assembly lipoprotein YfiO
VLVTGLLLSAGGCAFWRPTPTPILPPEELYQIGETELGNRRYDEARQNFRKIVERHPNSAYAARARFLVGEAFYREGEFDKAVLEFEAFLAFFPQHQIADLVQFRLAMSYYDQMKPVEQDQGLTVKRSSSSASSSRSTRRADTPPTASRRSTSAAAGSRRRSCGSRPITSIRAIRARPASGSSWC